MFQVVDAHADVFSKCIEDGLDYIRDSASFQASENLLRRGGVTLQWASVYVPKQYAAEAATHFALRIVGCAYDVTRRLGQGAVLVTSAKELRAAVDSSSPAYMLSMEGASPLAGSVERLDLFARLGVRVLGLTHNHDNECGDGCFAKEPTGLTPVGRTIAREACARGVLLDAAHLNRRGFDDVMSLASGPVVYSHGGSRALVESPRNLTDDQARAVAATGGVLGVDFYPGHIAPPSRKGTLEDVLDHLQHWIELVGPSAVGFGGDFDGIPTTLEGVENAAVYPALLEGLGARGFSDDVLAAVAGRNWLRVLDGAFSCGLASA